MTHPGPGDKTGQTTNETPQLEEHKKKTPENKKQKKQTPPKKPKEEHRPALHIKRKKSAERARDNGEANQTKNK
ncbi:hypothetical protein, partial [Pseudomonas syringae group genomosp. 7]|uniref:hypothetical protein n=1 Tax=Pseudomonas syringae group genomosp. 7 TaxID=251699 RepID=UPI00376F7C63